jgi:ectoine hydroxylase-related dioxygenase (phytanoyl-CoA dioxygenase family)
MTAARVKITEEDKRRFEKDGYWISPKLVDDERIARLRRAQERIWASDFDGDGYPMKGNIGVLDPHKVRKLDNGWWVNDEVRSIVCDPLIGELAADLLETDEIRLWHDQVIYKPGTGDLETNVGNIGWHQDYGYWQAASTSNMITAWIALQDTDLANGGMMTIVGSHRWGLIPESNTFFDQDLSGLRRKYEKEGREWNEEACMMKAGQVSFHHALTFHGSGPNRTHEPRLSIVAHLMPQGTAYRANVQYHPNVRQLGPRPKDGQLFDNEYFPVVFSRKAQR